MRHAKRARLHGFVLAVFLVCALVAPPGAVAADLSRSGAGPIASITFIDPAPLNPWGYTFDRGSLILNPLSNFCDYFNCIASFWNGTGYVLQCVDGTYSLSGGRTGACSSHGGPLRLLYAPGPGTTPSPGPTATPTPKPGGLLRR